MQESTIPKILGLDEAYAQLMSEQNHRVLQKFGSAILPVYGTEENGDISHYGTCIFLAFKGYKFLVSATHLMANSQMSKGVQLCVGIKGLPRIEGDYFNFHKNGIAPGENRDQTDISYMRLSESKLAELENVTFIAETDLALTSDFAAESVFSALGYPTKANDSKRALDKARSVIRPIVWSASGTEQTEDVYAALALDPHFNIAIKYDMAKLVDQTGRQTNGFVPKGLSGCGIWYLANRMNCEHYERDCTIDPKLTGILIEFRSDHHTLVGTRTSTLVRGILQDYPELRD